MKTTTTATHRLGAALAILFGSSLLMGCDAPTFTAKTTAPPGATADYYEDRDTDKRTIKITEGLAFALECSDSKGRPCAWDDSATTDGAIATARRAYGDLDQQLVRGTTPGQSSQRTRMLFVVTAHKPGTTTLNVKTGTETVEIKIEVVPAK